MTTPKTKPETPGTLFAREPSLSDESSRNEQFRAVAVARFKLLTEEHLPALAREHRWPIRLDHCFKRICLDHAFEDLWYRHLPRPAERHLSGQALARAVACAEELATGGLAVLARRNRESLGYRGKLPPALRR